MVVSCVFHVWRRKSVRPSARNGMGKGQAIQRNTALAQRIVLGGQQGQLVAAALHVDGVPRPKEAVCTVAMTSLVRVSQPLVVISNRNQVTQQGIVLQPWAAQDGKQMAHQDAIQDASSLLITPTDEFFVSKQPTVRKRVRPGALGSFGQGYHSGIVLLVQGCVLATRVGGDITGGTHAMGALVAIITVSHALELDNAIDCSPLS